MTHIDQGLLDPPGNGFNARQKRNWIAGTALVLVALVTYALVAAPRGPRTLREFDPERMAELELRMWEAYYGRQNVRLFGLLVTMLREQYHYSWVTATSEGYHLAKAAAAFGNARSNYGVVLPDLEAAYQTARQWLHAGFDPRAAAEAELAWWVARRTPGADSPEQVGRVMADAYALLYEVPAETVLRSAVLRAQAARARDDHASNPDWEAIGELLRQSYRELYTALSRRT